MSASAETVTEPQSQPQHIVIVGGGMVGISLALLLSKQVLEGALYCSISLIEQFPFPESSGAPQWQPSFDDRSTALSAGSVAILKALGCWQQLQDKVEAIESVHVSDRGHFGSLRLTASDYKMDAVGYVIQNRWLGQVLIQQLQQSTVRCLAPSKVTECKPVVGGYDIALTQVDAKAQTLHADLLLIADGADSEVRQSLGIATEVSDYHQSALIANVALSAPHQGVAYERFTDEGPIALLPLGDLEGVHRASLVWTLPEPVVERFQQMAESELIELLQQRFGYRAGTIRAIGERHIYPLKLVQALEQVRSHLVVIGNAAHFLHPVAGQGFNLALRDCQALADCLVKSQVKRQNKNASQQPLGSLEILNQYINHQQGDQRLTIGLTDQLVKLFSTEKLPLAVVRQLGLMSMNMMPVAKNQFAQRMMGVS